MATRYQNHVMTSVSPIVVGGIAKMSGEVQITVINVNVSMPMSQMGGLQIRDFGTPLVAHSNIEITIVIFPSMDFEMNLSTLRIISTVYEELISLDCGTIRNRKLRTDEWVSHGPGITQVLSIYLPHGRNNNNSTTASSSDATSNFKYYYRVNVELVIPFVFGFKNTTSGPRVSLLI